MECNPDQQQRAGHAEHSRVDLGGLKQGAE